VPVTIGRPAVQACPGPGLGMAGQTRSPPRPRLAWQRGPLTISGITQLVRAVGADASIPGLRPHRCRHTFGTRLR
jgi:integrase